MMRLRFPVSAVALALASLGISSPAWGQEGRIDDIQISQSDGAVSILVKLSEQPKSAAASQSGGGLLVEIDGVALPAFAFDPAGNVLVRHVAVTPAAGAPASKIQLDGAAFGPASTTIFRNAVLIETRLADPTLPSATSLMKSASSAAPAPAAKQATAETNAAPAPAKAALQVPAKPAAKPSEKPLEKPVEKAADAPREAPSADKKLAEAKTAALETRPLGPIAPKAPGAAEPTAAASGPDLGIGALAKLDAAACAAAEAQLAKDAWALPALGDRALCLIDQQKYGEAKNRLDQLAAFSPEDWRVALGRAALAEHAGDAKGARTAYAGAAGLAPDRAMREAITKRIAQLSLTPPPPHPPNQTPGQSQTPSQAPSQAPPANGPPSSASGASGASGASASGPSVERP